MTETTPGGATRLTTEQADESGAGSSRPESAAYLRVVLAELADLSRDDVDGLTPRMRADVADAADSGGSIEGRLGTPQAYAAELRAEAGLPPAPAARGRRRTARVRGWQGSVERRRRENAGFDDAVEFLVSLRPSWWVIRGLTVAILLVGIPVSVLDLGLGMLVLLGVPAAVLAVVLSVRLGRRTRGAGGSTPRVLVDLVLGAATLVLAVVALAMVLGVLGYHVPGRLSSTLARVGLSQPGTAYGPDNLYVYDANGHRVPSARVYDPDGNPVHLTSGDAITPDAMPRDFLGATQPNAYPRRAEGRLDPWVDPDAGSGVWVPPATIAPLVPGPNYTPPGTLKAPSPAATSRRSPGSTKTPATPSPASTTR